MPFKNLKQHSSLHLWKTESNCDKAKLAQLAGKLAQTLKPGDKVFLEGDLGAGKTTFAQGLLQELQVNRPPQGSPTFSLAHEYESPLAHLVHMDFYRLKSSDEIEESGLSAAFDERNWIILTEWISLFPDFLNQQLSLALSQNPTSKKESLRIFWVELEWEETIPTDNNELCLDANRSVRIYST